MEFDLTFNDFEIKTIRTLCSGFNLVFKNKIKPHHFKIEFTAIGVYDMENNLVNRGVQTYFYNIKTHSFEKNSIENIVKTIKNPIIKTVCNKRKTYAEIYNTKKKAEI